MKWSIFSSPGKDFCGKNFCKGLLLGLVLVWMVGSPDPAAAQEQVKAHHILVGSKEEADSVRKQIESEGGTRKAFSAAARKYSKDPTTKLLGGDVSWFSKGGKLEASFTNTAFALQVGDMSAPVKTQFGWHLIFVTDRRDRVTKAAQPKVAIEPEDPVSSKRPVPHDHDGDGKPDHADCEHGVAAKPPQNQLSPALKPELTTTPVAVRRPQRRGKGFRVSLETVKGGMGRDRASTFLPSEALELSIVLKNKGASAQAFFAPELLPLGLKVTLVGDSTAIPGDFESVAKLEAPFVSVGTYEIVGQEVMLNDYWKGLTEARYSVTWDLDTLVANAVASFPDIGKAAEFKDFTASARRALRISTDIVVRDPTPRGNRKRTSSLPVSVFDVLKPDGDYVAEIRFQNGDPLVIKLHSKEQIQAVRHFANLANSGFYDGLNFFEVEAGEYALGGDATKTGTGAPPGNLPLISNTAKLQHKKGTVSFVSRDVRSKGPLSGGQVGSIFVVCLKDRPEWDEQHVPFGEVLSGLEVFEKSRIPVFVDVTVMTAGQQQARPGPTAQAKKVTGNPQAIIKTSKGDVTVELHEKEARNTVANFITLAEGKFYDKIAEGEGKQQFIYLMPGDDGPILIQAGSPTNDAAGGPGYSIPDEVNAKKHVKGALVMVVAHDEKSGKVIPGSAGSQFFICLKDIPYYDHQMTNTVFGQVVEGSAVLEKLEEGDEIQSIEIKNKRPRPYKVNKIQ